jgi:hypothetical protein
VTNDWLDELLRELSVDLPPADLVTRVRLRLAKVRRRARWTARVSSLGATGLAIAAAAIIMRPLRAAPSGPLVGDLGQILEVAAAAPGTVLMELPLRVQRWAQTLESGLLLTWVSLALPAAAVLAYLLRVDVTEDGAAL